MNADKVNEGASYCLTRFVQYANAEFASRELSETGGTQRAAVVEKHFESCTVLG